MDHWAAIPSGPEPEENRRLLGRTRTDSSALSVAPSWSHTVSRNVYCPASRPVTVATAWSAPSSFKPAGPLRRKASPNIQGDVQQHRWVESPDGVPAVADDATVVGAATAIKQQAVHREKQPPVWTHNGHRAPV